MVSHKVLRQSPRARVFSVLAYSTSEQASSYALLPERALSPWDVFRSLRSRCLVGVSQNPGSLGRVSKLTRARLVKGPASVVATSSLLPRPAVLSTSQLRPATWAVLDRALGPFGGKRWGRPCCLGRLLPAIGSLQGWSHWRHWARAVSRTSRPCCFAPLRSFASNLGCAALGLWPFGRRAMGSPVCSGPAFAGYRQPPGLEPLEALKNAGERRRRVLAQVLRVDR